MSIYWSGLRDELKMALRLEEISLDWRLRRREEVYRSRLVEGEGLEGQKMFCIGWKLGC